MMNPWSISAPYHGQAGASPRVTGIGCRADARAARLVASSSTGRGRRMPAQAVTMDYVDAAGLRVARALHAFVASAAPGSGVDADAFWRGFAQIVAELGPRVQEALDTRDTLQAKIDAWHRDRKGRASDAAA